MRDFKSIYSEFEPRISRYLSHLVSEEDAPDLTQTVFLKISRSLYSFREESSLSTWIYRIATNTALDHTSSSLTQKKRSEELLDEDGSMDDFSIRISRGLTRSIFGGR